MGSGIRVRELGLVGYILWFSRTLGQALRRLVRYGRILCEDVQFQIR